MTLIISKLFFGLNFKQTTVEHALNIKNSLTLSPVSKHTYGSVYSLLKTIIINKFNIIGRRFFVGFLSNQSIFLK